MKTLFTILSLFIASFAHSQVVAYAGPDQTVELFDDVQFKLDGTGSAGPITAVSWRYISPAWGNATFDYTAEIMNPGSSVTQVKGVTFVKTGLQFELTVTDGTDTDRDTVVVYVNHNVPPQSPNGAGYRLMNSTDAAIANAPNPGVYVAGRDYILEANFEGYDNTEKTGTTKRCIRILPGQLPNVSDTSVKFCLAPGDYLDIQIGDRVFGTDRYRQWTGADSIHKTKLTSYGRVRSARGFHFTNMKNFAFDGEYKPGVSGSPNYIGHAGTGIYAYTFNRGQYLFQANAGWAWLGSYGISFNGRTDSTDLVDNGIRATNANISVKFVEVGHGFFGGFSFKDSGGDNVYYNLEITQCYIYFLISEVVYAGSTQGLQNNQWQSIIKDLWYHDNRAEYCGGEAFQIGKCSGGIIENNVFLACGSNIGSPFQAQFQNNGFQVETIDGGIIFRKNLLIGAAENLINYFHTQPQANPAWTTWPDKNPNDTVRFHKNVFLYCQNNIGAYFGNFNTTAPGYGIVIDSCYFGYFDFRNDRPVSQTNTNFILRTLAYMPYIISRNNFRDATKTQMFDKSGGTTTGQEINTTVTSIPLPEYRNSGWPTNTNFAYVSYYADSSRKTNGNEDGYTLNGPKINVQAGRYYLWLSHVWLCLTTGTNESPSTWSSDWQLITYTVNGVTKDYPPGDTRLAAGSYYDNLGIGVRTYNSSGTEPPPPTGNFQPLINVNRLRRSKIDTE